jgi:hypothetical protein
MKFKINIKFYSLLKYLDDQPLSETQGLDLPFPTKAELVQVELKVKSTKMHMLSKKDQQKAKIIRENTIYTDYDVVLKLVCTGLGITLVAYGLHRNACIH